MDPSQRPPHLNHIHASKIRLHGRRCKQFAIKPKLTKNETEERCTKCNALIWAHPNKKRRS